MGNQNSQIKKRSSVDFSNHIMEKVESGGTVVYKFYKPGTRIYSITFINSNGIMAVTGDCMNWIFCREFHPSNKPNDGVSDAYWNEKLRISSCQVPYDFDSEETIKALEYALDNDEDLSDEESEYLNDCIRHADDGELEYLHYAYNNNVGRYEDCENVIVVKSIKPSLKCIYDAFDEMCRRLRDGEVF